MDYDTSPTGAPDPRRNRQSIFFIPIAIVVGMGLIAAAMYLSRANAPLPIIAPHTTHKTVAAGMVPPVTARDHILGNPNAPIVMIEYTDFDCPYCQAFQTTMHEIMTNYGADGKVAWVLRNLPFQQLHPNAPGLALDAECVASLGGNNAYWKFVDLLFSRPSGSETDLTNIPGYVQQVGVDQTKYQDCVNAGAKRSIVQHEFNDAIAAGAQGTPYTVITVGNQHFTIAGARPYNTVAKVLDTLLNQLNGVTSQSSGTSTASSTAH